MLYVAEFQTFVLLVQTTLSLSSGSEQALLSSRALVVNQPKGRGRGRRCSDRLLHFLQILYRNGFDLTTLFR